MSTAISLQLRMIIYIRILTNYRKFLDNTVKELCSILGGEKNVYFDRMFGDYINATAPEFLHPCPYSGRVGLTNFSTSILSSASPDFLMPSTFK